MPNRFGHDLYREPPTREWTDRTREIFSEADDRRRFNPRQLPREDDRRCSNAAMETETGDRHQITENSYDPRMHRDRVRLNRLASNDLFFSDDRSVNSSPRSPHPRSTFSRIAPSRGDLKKTKTEERDSDPNDKAYGFESRRNSNDPRRRTNMSPPVGESSGLSNIPIPSGPRSERGSDGAPYRVHATPIKGSSHPQARSNSSNDQDSLFKAFARYTDSVIHTSALMFERNLVKEKADKHQILKDRWKKHYPSFLSLAEDHDRASENAVLAAQAFDHQIKQNDEVQEKAVRTLVASIVDNNAQVSAPLNRELNTLKEDIHDTKMELRDTRYDGSRAKEPNSRTMSSFDKADLMKIINKVQSSVDQYKGLLAHKDVQGLMDKLNASGGDINQANKKLKELETKMQSLQDNLAAHKSASQTLHENWTVQNQDYAQSIANQKRTVETLIEDYIAYKTHLDPEMTRHEKRLESLAEDLAAQKQDLAQSTESQKKDFESVANDLNGQKEHLALKLMEQEKKLGKLIEDFHAEKANIQQLKVEIIGDPEKSDGASKGLIDYIGEGRENSVKVEDAILQLDKEVGGFAERLQKIESGLVMFGSREPNPESAAPKIDTASSVLEAVPDEALLNLEQRVKAIAIEQEEKDDLVSGEVERLDNILISQEKAIRDVQNELSALKSKESSTNSNKPPTPPPQIENQWKSDESLKLKVEEFESTLRQFKETATERIDAIDVLVESHQQRYDNLSTEQLSNSIIQHMQVLYPPHPANLHSKIDQIQARLATAEAHIRHFMGLIGKLTENSQSHFNRIEDIQGGQIPKLDRRVTEATNSIPGLLQESDRKRTELAALTANCQFLSQRIAESPREFDQKLEDLRRVLSDRVEKLDAASRDSLSKPSSGDTDVKHDMSGLTITVDSGTKNLAELTRELLSGQKSSQILSYDLRNDLEGLNKELENERKALSLWKSEQASETTSLNTAIEATQIRLSDVESTITKELASLHGSLTALKRPSNSQDSPKRDPSFGVSQTLTDTQTGEGNDSDTPLALKTTPARSLRSTLVRKNEKSFKRKRDDSSDDYYSSDDSDPPIARPMRKSNRGIQMAEKRIKTRLRAASDGGENGG